MKKLFSWLGGFLATVKEIGDLISGFKGTKKEEEPKSE